MFWINYIISCTLEISRWNSLWYFRFFNWGSWFLSRLWGGDIILYMSSSTSRSKVHLMWYSVIWEVISWFWSCRIIWWLGSCRVIWWFWFDSNLEIRLRYLHFIVLGIILFNWSLFFLLLGWSSSYIECLLLWESGEVIHIELVKFLFWDSVYVGSILGSFSNFWNRFHEAAVWYGWVLSPIYLFLDKLRSYLCFL